MNIPAHLADALNHPLIREGRFLEVAREYIDACAGSPHDFSLRRRAHVLLGQITRLYWAQGQVPSEGVACFWHFVEAVPAFLGQADAVEALDEEPRGLVEAAMAEAAAGIRENARHWARRTRPVPVNPRHLFLVTLPHSGVSAIAPILQDYLESEGFVSLVEASDLPAALASVEAEGRRAFTWFHPTHEEMENWLARPDIAVAYLHRDPRDVLVSSICVDEPNAAVLLGSIIGYRLDELCVDSIPYFQALAETDPATVAVTFQEMKADVLGCARRMLGLLGLEIDGERLGRLCEAYSFQAMAGRKEGEGAVFTRLGPYVVRKGTSGQWRERFDRTCALFFAAKYGHLLMATGWVRDMSWIDEVQG